MFRKPEKQRMPARQVRVDYGICHFCGACVGACPENAIFLRSSHLVITRELCTECGRCAAACPLQALSYIDAQAEAAP